VLSKIVDDGRPRALFAYSYAARDLLRFAQSRRWRTVLGQIDPGPREEEIVAELSSNTSAQHEWRPAPKAYWEKWREECALADRIAVNSAWSRLGLEQAGIPPEKIDVIPLGFEAPAEARTFRRQYPACFTSSRPLRVLFLGQINLRKGAIPLLQATRMLRGEPCEFWFVGRRQIGIDSDLASASNIRWLGQVPRHQTHAFYRDADLFVLPTYSDGFALTQLEAQAWRLPIIASRYCGEVVQDGRNGYVLDEISPGAIAERILAVLRNPQGLQWLSDNANCSERFSLASLATRLVAVLG
jgi:glycosyltransferase involved in cell wall biosynthesis